MIKIIVAPDSFKGSINARDAAHAIALGVSSVLPGAKIIETPVADGGEGTLDLLVEPSNRHLVRVCRTDGEPINAEFGILGELAIIEMSRAAGLGTVPEAQRNPENSTTKGVGQLMLAALDRGCREIMLTVGGSGSNDGGCGMLEALGARFYDGDGPISEIRAKDLSRIARIDLDGLDQRLFSAKLTLACDVENPLCGEHGATYVFGPQKGADPSMLDRLEAGMKNYAKHLNEATKNDVSSLPGMGAGGGIGFPLVAIFGAEVRSGIVSMLDALRFDDRLEGASLVITGEGKFDFQSLNGKAIAGVAAAAKRKNIPVLALVGITGEGSEKIQSVGVKEIRALTELTSDREYSISHAAELLQELTVKAIKNMDHLEG